MRLSTTAGRDEAGAVATIQAAHDAGVRWFDTAHAYALDEGELGHNERLLGRALAGREAFIVTKGGMSRPAGAWEPDGRASRIRRDALDAAIALGRPIDVFLLHSPDPATSWATSVRALGGLLDEGVVRAIGVCNVNLARLDEALAVAPISVVQVGLSLLDDEPLYSGVVARCLERGVTVMAHSPLGGPKRVARLLRTPVLSEVAGRRGVSAASVALGGVLAVAANIVVIPGVRRAEVARTLSQVPDLSAEELELLRPEFPALRAVRRAGAVAERDGEVVMLMGLQGAGKTSQVAEWEGRGFVRLNRDTSGGTLRDLVRRLEAQLAQGVTRVVLDNTYLTRASRAPVLAVAQRHGLKVRGVWFDTSLADAQVNVIERMLAAHGRLLSPAELRRGKENTMLPPMAQLRSLKELEVPVVDEGFAWLDTVPFTRRAATGVAGRLVALEQLGSLTADPRPTLVFGWKRGVPESEVAALKAQAASLGAELAVCTHDAGPPSCWCRPPLPGLLLEFARRAQVDLTRSELLGSTANHVTLARVVGAQFRGSTGSP